ncbi:hypothetical protein [Pseudomonas syringae]|uniref:hypothetical protein n=1 Tax=Pseudomonas syringae TaxID=317 RepID=UPI000E322D0F|nr:hypothetical protein [Pseudomonas syringae]
MTIDWSKAPEGATHYYKGSPQPWRDLSGYNWKYFMNGEWHLCPSCCTSAELMRELGKVLFALPLPQAWNGEGLPPVGTTCERRFYDVEGSSWMGCIILAHGSKRIFYRDNCGDEFAHSLEEVEFRPFRTAEQIAADERLHKVRNALTAIKASRHFPSDEARQNVMVATVEAMIDAGFAQQVAP